VLFIQASLTLTQLMEKRNLGIGPPDRYVATLERACASAGLTEARDISRTAWAATWAEQKAVRPSPDCLGRLLTTLNPCIVPITY
jgi:hypothetical protein